MKTNYSCKAIYLVILLTLTSLGCSREEEDELVPDLVRGENMGSIAIKGNVSTSIQILSQRYIIVSATNTIPSEVKSKIIALKGKITSSIDEVGIATVTSSDPEFLSKALKINGISTVLRDYKVQWINPEEKKVKMQVTYGNPPSSDDDDFFFDLQWGHDAINAPEAWNAGYRGAGARVAVLDTGFDLEHPDLAPNIDRSASRSFVPGEDLQYSIPDPFSHGTHVAGTIAAADNGFGTIGVAPEAKLILVKVLSDQGFGDFSWIIEGIVHAVHQRADVINMSLRGYFPKNGKFRDENGKVYYEEKYFQKLFVALNKVTTYAAQRGVSIITAAGNDEINGNKDNNYVIMPAEATHVISISATSPRGWALHPYSEFLDYPTSYTNYGTPEVDLAAPGGDYVYPGDEEETIGFVTAPAWVFDMVFSTGNDYSWYWAAGTSMAAPHASGVAALIIGKNGGNMKPSQVEALLKSSAEDLGKPGRDPYYGHGRVDAYKAVTSRKAHAKAFTLSTDKINSRK